MITKELLLKLGFEHDTWPKPFPSWYNIFDSSDDPPCSEVYTYTVWQSDGSEGPYCFVVFLSPRGPFGVFESNSEFGAPSQYVRIKDESDVGKGIETITKFSKDLESKLNQNI
jgi:hypothetical protein